MRNFVRAAVHLAAVPLAITCLAVPTSGTVLEWPAHTPVECPPLRGCHGYDEMDEFLAMAEELVLDFVLSAYAPQLLVVDLRYVPEGESIRSMCTEPGGGRAVHDEFSYEYCRADNVIYIGQRRLWSLYTGSGDAAPVVALAHEFGHFLQKVGDVPPAGAPAASVHLENQADCVAGAWFAAAEAAGVAGPGDLEEAAHMFDLIGESGDDKDRTHGTAMERKQAFGDGRAGGLEACSEYFPSTPLRSERERGRWDSVTRALRAQL